LEVQILSPSLFKFRSFDLDAVAGELRSSGAIVKLQPQPLKVLILLVSRAGQLVTREEIRQEVWGDNTFVDFEHGLNFCISQIREALQDTAGHPEFVETVPRRGYRFVAAVDVPRTQTLPIAPPEVTARVPAMSYWFMRTLVVAVTLLVAVGLFSLIRRVWWHPVAHIRSIAVLPLLNMSGDPNQDYFADGMTEALITNLSKLKELKVISRTSVMQYKGSSKPLPQIARELGVDGIVEGSVLRAGSRVRITAQLISAATDTHLWADSFDRDPGDVLALQSEVARAIAEQVRVAASPAEQQQLASGAFADPEAHNNPEAYNAYLEGRYFFWRSNDENVRRSITYFEQAIQLDPSYAAAWAGVAAAYIRQADAGSVLTEEGYLKGRAAAQQALALDPNLAEAHAIIGYIKTNFEWDWVGAEASYKRALTLEPGSAYVVSSASMLPFALGRFEEAMELQHRGVELDPLNAQSRIGLGASAYNMGRLEEALAQTRKALELDPNVSYEHVLLGLIYVAQEHPQQGLEEIERESPGQLRLYGEALAYHALGNKKKSKAALGQLVAKYQTVAAYQIAEVHAYRGDTNNAFAWLERAYYLHDSGVSSIKGDPLLNNIRNDLRYAIFLKKMHLPA
jgi:TolB-like protein/DNA-binding winged helix-turn-helix (wHTH) protein/Tfp pilus assembly protein PilF